VIAELSCADHEAKIAIRNSQRLGLRLSRLSAVKNDAEKTLTGTYLVTGGLGGLGLASVEWLVQRGVRHIALISRSKPDHAASELLQRLKSQGVHVTAFQADVSNKTRLEQVLDAIRQPDSGFLPLRGIIHSAGTLSDGMLANQTEDKFKQVYSAKISGAWNLHELTRQDNLEQFILFSSIASVIGAPGQTNYGAANAFLDALAQYRHMQGLPALSINWGPWSEVGMARAWSGLHGARGVTGLPTPQGISLLNTAITLNQYQQLVIADIDWTRFAVSMTSDMRVYLSSLVGNDIKVDTPVSDDLQTLVVRTLKSTLGFAKDDQLGADDNFFDLGMDSLLAMQFNESLKTTLKENIELPMVVIFQHPTLNSLVAHIQTLQEK
jgi:NADP-dependent 3-hydroxy acid dehydrogenase YdfG/aryl carrier-like protein